MRLSHSMCLLLEWFLVALSDGKVFLSDECAVYCISLSRNVFGGKTESSLYAWDIRPPSTQDDSAGVTASCITGPDFFDGTVGGVNVLNVELCYTGARQQWHYVAGVISARWSSSAFHPDSVWIPQWIVNRSVYWLGLCSIPFATAT
jgi:hypothetical protein